MQQMDPNQLEAYQNQLMQHSTQRRRKKRKRPSTAKPRVSQYGQPPRRVKRKKKRGSRRMRPMNEEEQLAAMIQENPQLREQLQAQQMQEEEALDQIHEVAE